MLPVFDDVACASLPPDALPLLAPLRCEPGLHVAHEANRLWLRFEAGSERVLRAVLPLRGVELFAFRDGTWRRFGQSLPAFDFPRHPRFEPLFQALVPAPVLPIAPGAAPVMPFRLSLVPDDRPRPTTAVLCSLTAIASWAGGVSRYRLERLHAIMRQRQVLIFGDKLPLVADGVRLWGKLVLVPLGWRPEPDLPEGDLREAAGVAAEEVLLLQHDRIEALPRTALARLSRASLRLAVERVS
jgi:MoxR-vWA-beta-propeller ternary system domain bpX2